MTLSQPPLPARRRACPAPGGAGGLRRLTKRPARVLASPLLRTRQTAAHPHRRSPAGRRALRPVASCGRALFPQEPLRRSSPRSRDARIAVIGHEPDLSVLLAACPAGSARSRRLRVAQDGGGASDEVSRAAPAGRLPGSSSGCLDAKGAARGRLLRWLWRAKSGSWLRGWRSVERPEVLQPPPRPPRPAAGRANQTRPISAMKMIPET